ncbi:hypothetical protein GCM10010121_078310 [Streptomyces brasiliensis]|uniref:Uncharacterized protein n=1 Tax=Streptomyces brasiliensis TaxID=1954 RepID=A0A917P2E2_9ACTN|nr:hypothetical protein GCM10010121_078310 [Streptomyces brasiliensis]
MWPARAPEIGSHITQPCLSADTLPSAINRCRQDRRQHPRIIKDRGNESYRPWRPRARTGLYEEGNGLTEKDVADALGVTAGGGGSVRDARLPSAAGPGRDAGLG